MSTSNIYTQSDAQCLNCHIHCQEDHAKLVAENNKLKEENLELEEKILALQKQKSFKGLCYTYLEQFYRGNTAIICFYIHFAIPFNE